jgi:DNA-binding CsgD family transcriptional regulator
MSSSIQTQNSDKSLEQLVSAPDYFVKVSAVVGQLHAAKTQAAALDLLFEANRLMGLDASVFASFIRDDETHESYRFMLACDPRWCFEYEKHAKFADDPWLIYACSHSEPIRGHEMQTYTRRQQNVLRVAEDFGFRSSLIIPSPSSGGISRLGVLCLGSNQPGFFDSRAYVAIKMLARSLAMELHDWWVRLVREELITDADLTNEDLELLRLQRLGQGSKDIARALPAMTIRAVDSRFHRINAKLGTPSRKAAARIAAEYGLI